MAQFVSIYGVWVVASFIALESIGLPLPAEAALMAAAFFAARTHALDISYLIGVAVLAAVVGETAGFWIGRKFGYHLLDRFGARIGLTRPRIKAGQKLFARYGGRFVFAARFLPFFRNMAAMLAGTSTMEQVSFYFASATAAASWIACYGLGSYFFGETFTNLASPVALVLSIVALLIIVAVPVLIVRYEMRLVEAEA